MRVNLRQPALYSAPLYATLDQFNQAMEALQDSSPIQQIENLKTFLFTYIVLAPLLSALFAEHIDNWFFACVLFVGLVIGALMWVRIRLAELEESLRDQERKLEELSARADPEL
jgi:Na+/H+ antiporter NhaD/arsenite permease-like protein